MKNLITILLLFVTVSSYSQGGITTIKVGGVDTAAMLLPYKTAYPRLAISLTTTGSSGAATYNNVSGVLNIPNYAGGSTPSLQQVTDVGTSTTNPITASSLFVKTGSTNMVELVDFGGRGSVNILDLYTGGYSHILTSGSHQYTFPYTSGYVPMTVNGNAADSTGNILLSGGGTVTSVAALTLGTSGTDLGSSVANPTTTPVITLNVPTASASNRGALSSTDWSTFNSKLSTSGATYTTTTGNGLDINSSTLTSGKLISLISSGTAAASNGQTVLYDSTYGANATSAQTTFAGVFANTHTGTTSVNIGLKATATGGSTNYALQTVGASLIGGNIAFQTNNTYDFGTSTSSVKDLYVVSAVKFNSTTSITPTFIQLTNMTLYRISAGVFSLYENGGTFNRLQLGGQTSSFGAIAGSGANILIKDASDGTASSLGVGVSSVVASAKLQVDATDKGFLPPRMTATQASAISSPAEGLLVYVTDTNGTFLAKGWWGYDGAAWQKLNN